MQFFSGYFSQKLPPLQAQDTSLPTFAGISGVVAKADGSFEVFWNPATTSKPPIRYEVYCAPGSVSAASLFGSQVNVSKIVSALENTTRIHTYGSDDTYFFKGDLYTFGVKAVDAQGYVSSSVVIDTESAIGSGNLAEIFQDVAAALIDRHNDFVADHAAFVVDRAAFDADQAAFDADQAAFDADQAAFDDDQVAFDADQVAFDNLHALLQSDRNPVKDITAYLSESDEEIRTTLSNESEIVAVVEKDE